MSNFIGIKSSISERVNNERVLLDNVNSLRNEGIFLQATYGSPVRPILQLQIPLCITTKHSASIPQALSLQGSKHKFLIHALFLGQSGSTMHSGRHKTYGLPKKPIGHLQS